MKRLTAALCVCIGLTLGMPARSQNAAFNLDDIAVEAYIYLYPLISMDITRKQMTNVLPGTQFGRDPTNVISNVPSFPPSDYKVVVRPNFDTLYSVAWIDLGKEPMIVSAPDTNGRYYLLPMLDMWSDVFASPGWRTTGTQAGNFMLTAPGWTGTVPAGITHLPAPTPVVWMIGRTKTDGPPDYPEVHRIQAGYKLTPLSQWGKPAVPVETRIDPSIDMKTPPKSQVDTMPGTRYFSYGAELMRIHPPHGTDQPILARMKLLGIEAGKPLDVDKLSAAMKAAIDKAPAAAQHLMAWKVPTLASVVNGWSMNRDTMGAYGNYYLKRAIVAQLGLGANLPEDAIYPLNLGDSTGAPLHGANRYVLHFAKGETPPVNAFWSVTLYDDDGFQVPNSLSRFAVSSWMPFQYNPDGSLSLYIQNANPGPGREANWLPAPAGNFNLTMRLYSPKAVALTGEWNPPPVTRSTAPRPVSAQ